MKRIIDGKRYDTETAECLADISRCGDRGNFRWDDTYLYRTKNGRYFIAGEGNAASRWAHRYDDGMRGPGSGIAAIDADEARELLEGEHSKEAQVALEKYFPIEEA